MPVEQTVQMIETPAARCFVEGLVAAMGLGDGVHVPGTTVVPSADRAGSAMVVAYAVAAHTVLWCDPALAHDLEGFADPGRTLALADVEASSTARGWEHVGRSRMLLPPADGLIAATDSGPGFVIRSLDANTLTDRSMLDTFAACLSEDDREEADLDGGEFDDHILAVVDERGIAALASQQPFDHALGFGDIADATRDDAVGRGLGRRSGRHQASVTCSLRSRVRDPGRPAPQRRSRVAGRPARG